jgi:hypothetical protein
MYHATPDLKATLLKQKYKSTISAPWLFDLDEPDFEMPI